MLRRATPPIIASQSFIECSRKTNGEFASQRPRLSLYPEYHAGIGLDYYAQFSSPIRRYADLVLQRQVIAALARPDRFTYSQEELLAVLAGAENAEADGRELERRAKRYWTLRYLAAQRRRCGTRRYRNSRRRQRRTDRLRRARHLTWRTPRADRVAQSWCRSAESIRCAAGSRWITCARRPKSLKMPHSPVRFQISDFGQRHAAKLS